MHWIVRLEFDFSLYRLQSNPQRGILGRLDLLISHVYGCWVAAFIPYSVRILVRGYGRIATTRGLESPYAWTRRGYPYGDLDQTDRFWIEIQSGLGHRFPIPCSQAYDLTVDAISLLAVSRLPWWKDGLNDGWQWPRLLRNYSSLPITRTTSPFPYLSLPHNLNTTQAAAYLTALRSTCSVCGT